MAKILKEDDGQMVVEIEDLTFANLLAEYLWEVKGVKFAGMLREHPYLEKPKVIVSSGDPRKSIESAARKIAEDAESMKKHAKK